MPAASTQLVVGLSDDWSDNTITLHRLARSEPGGEWGGVGTAVGPWEATIGHAGLGWGIGVHGVGAPAGMSGPTKAEGDGRSPAGLFAIGEGFGYDAAPPKGTRADYTKLDKSWRCVDDPTSKHYNRVFSERGVDKDWSSAERMRRSDVLYRWVVLIDHNRIATGASGSEAPATPKAGSCIFFHVWREPGSPTVGCAAMDQKNIESLMTWLDPAAKPLVLLLPKAQYEALRGPWSLPRL